MESIVAALPEASTTYGPKCAGKEPWEAHAACMEMYTEIVRAHSDLGLVLLLGDRYETHAAALAAHFLRIPIAHIHGGETTTGAFDDALRHGITHMAGTTGLHFVATEQAQDKVQDLLHVQFGMLDPPDNVHLVGAPGLDTIPQNCAKRDKYIIVVSFYPETTSTDFGESVLCAMLAALSLYADGQHAIFFSHVNNDPGSDMVRTRIGEFIAAHPLCASWISPNTRQQYLHLCEHAWLAIGNTSSIPIEMPWMGVPAVLVGNRQNGRPIADGIFSPESGMENSVTEIAACIDDALQFRGYFNPIYRGGAAEGIAKVVREFVANV